MPPGKDTDMTAVWLSEEPGQYFYTWQWRERVRNEVRITKVPSPALPKWYFLSFFTHPPIFMSFSLKRFSPTLGQREKKKLFNGPAQFLSDKVLLWKHSGLSLHVSITTGARKDVSPAARGLRETPGRERTLPQLSVNNITRINPRHLTSIYSSCVCAKHPRPEEYVKNYSYTITQTRKSLANTPARRS